jgi:hypothetical protein
VPALSASGIFLFSYYTIAIMIHINYIAVVVAAVAAFIIGFLMHGPALGKLWMRLANIVPTGNEKFSDMTGKMFWNFVVNLVTALGLAIVIDLVSTSPIMSASSTLNGIICGVLVWFAFIATSTSIEVIWMGKSFKLWFFEFFSSFVVMVAVGAIIGAW